jgi:antitoxin VapB
MSARAILVRAEGQVDSERRRAVPLHDGTFPPFWYLYTTALNIKDPETERLADEVAELTGETKTRAVKVALDERLSRLKRRVTRRNRGEALRRLLEDEIWPQIPRDVLGKPVPKEEREAILGYGPEGV